MHFVKKRLTIFLAANAVFLMVFVPAAFAEEPTTITDAQLVQVRSHCSEIKTTLRQLHASDAVVRVNRGKLYERISTKLMAPLNSRIALNRLDGTGLGSITSEYAKHLTTFRATYQDYEETLSSLININCLTQPARFYNSLEDVRTKRDLVYESVNILAQDIISYKAAFDEFAAPYKEEAI